MLIVEFRVVWRFRKLYISKSVCEMHCPKFWKGFRSKLQFTRVVSVSFPVAVLAFSVVLTLFQWRIKKILRDLPHRIIVAFVITHNLLIGADGRDTVLESCYDLQTFD